MSIEVQCSRTGLLLGCRTQLCLVIQACFVHWAFSFSHSECWLSF